MFTKDELEAISVFKDKVLPTIAAEQKINPSGTSYLMGTMIADMVDGGLLLNLAKPVAGLVGSVGRMTPVVSEAFKEGTESLYAKEANEAIENFILNMETNPWISNITQTIIRDKLRKEKGGDSDIKELPSEFRPQSELETDEDILVAEAETPQQQVGNVNVTSPRINIDPTTSQPPRQMASLPSSPSVGGGITNVANRQQFGGLFPGDNIGKLIAEKA